MNRCVADVRRLTDVVGMRLVRPIRLCVREIGVDHVFEVSCPFLVPLFTNKERMIGLWIGMSSPTVGYDMRLLGDALYESMDCVVSLGGVSILCCFISH